MNDNLYVNSQELTNIQNEIKEIQSRFKALNDEFETKLKELESYWSGPDYNAMATNIKTKMLPITGPTGSIDTLMNNMVNEVSQKASDYSAIQKKNIGYWG